MHPEWKSHLSNGFCFMYRSRRLGRFKSGRKPANDPLQEWWQCVKEVRDLATYFKPLAPHRGEWNRSRSRLSV